MVNISQRISQLRSERGMSRAELSAALGLPKTAAEKFETGRQTPTQEQQEKLCSIFGVSLFYLKGESEDRTSMGSWMENAYSEPDPEPAKTVRRAEKTVPTGDSASIFESFAASKQFKESLRSAVMEVLRSEEGRKLIAQEVHRQLLKK